MAKKKATIPDPVDPVQEELRELNGRIERMVVRLKEICADIEHCGRADHENMLCLGVLDKRLRSVEGSLTSLDAQLTVYPAEGEPIALVPALREELAGMRLDYDRAIMLLEAKIEDAKLGPIRRLWKKWRAR